MKEIPSLVITMFFFAKSGSALLSLTELRRRPQSSVRNSGVSSGKAFSAHAATFRKGEIGDWRNHFAPEHEQAYLASAGEHLAAYGYS